MTGRRAFLQWLGAAPVATVAPRVAFAATAGAAASARAADLGRGHVRLQDERLSLHFDDRMRSRLVRLGGPRPLALTGFDAGESIVIVDGQGLAGDPATPPTTPCSGRCLPTGAIMNRWNSDLGVTKGLFPPTPQPLYIKPLTPDPGRKPE